ncbi:hypothetical protein C1H46_002088 [Malus baccata]|uniref:Secreted protein n=1 Tax=Malus baccata TaxID=106549 RepID=A0A540NN45_MALBA|nr:hypothetical protein C1H46_002088 [Malus baccata]
MKMMVVLFSSICEVLRELGDGPCVCRGRGRVRESLSGIKNEDEGKITRTRESRGKEKGKGKTCNPWLHSTRL